MNTNSYTGVERRSAVRRDVTVSAMLRSSGTNRVKVALRDISEIGFCCEYASELRIGDKMWLKFDNLEAMDVVVVRRDGYYYGMSFVRPLHVSTLEFLVQSYGKALA